MDIQKPLLMKSAEVVDAWRVVPRLVLLAYGALTLHVVNWFMTIPEPTTSQMVLVTTIAGFGTAVIGLYNSSSKNWVEYNREFTDRILKLDDPKAYIQLTTARLEERENRGGYTPSYMPSYSNNYRNQENPYRQDYDDLQTQREYDNQGEPRATSYQER